MHCTAQATDWFSKPLQKALILRRKEICLEVPTLDHTHEHGCRPGVTTTVQVFLELPRQLRQWVPIHPSSPCCPPPVPPPTPPPLWPLPLHLLLGESSWQHWLPTCFWHCEVRPLNCPLQRSPTSTVGVRGLQHSLDPCVANTTSKRQGSSFKSFSS